MKAVQYFVNLARKNKLIAHATVHRPTAIFALMWFFMVAYFASAKNLRILNLEFILTAAALYFALAFIATFNSIFDRVEDREAAKINKYNKSVYVALFLSDFELKVHSAIYAFASLGIAYIVNAKFTIVVAALMAGGFLYSSPPIRLKARPFFDIATYFLGAFLLPILSIWAVWKIFNLELLLFSLIAAFFIASFWPVNQAIDYEADKKFKVRTTVVALGIKKAAKIGLLFSFAAMVLSLSIALLFKPFSIFLPIFVSSTYVIFKFYKNTTISYDKMIKLAGHYPMFVFLYAVASVLILIILNYI